MGGLWKKTCAPFWICQWGLKIQSNIVKGLEGTLKSMLHSIPKGVAASMDGVNMITLSFISF